MLSFLSTFCYVILEFNYGLSNVDASEIQKVLEGCPRKILIFKHIPTHGQEIFKIPPFKMIEKFKFTLRDAKTLNWSRN